MTLNFSRRPDDTTKRNAGRSETMQILVATCGQVVTRIERNAGRSGDDRRESQAGVAATERGKECELELGHARL